MIKPIAPPHAISIHYSMLASHAHECSGLDIPDPLALRLSPNLPLLIKSLHMSKPFQNTLVSSFNLTAFTITLIKPILLYNSLQDQLISLHMSEGI